METTSTRFNGLEMATRGLSKVDRYSWNKGIGELGKLSFISKHRLRMPDERTQRSQEDQEGKIKGIAAKFEWAMFAVLVVIKRPDDEEYLYIADGGGRWSAAMRRADIDEVPCIVFEMDSLSDEARVFLGINTWRKPPRASAKFGPQLTACDPDARLVEAVLASIGRRVAKHPSAGTVSCVSTLMKHAAADPERLRRVMPLVQMICEGHAIEAVLVDALMYIDKHMEGPELLTDRRWANRLKVFGPQRILLEARRQAQMYNRGGARVWASGVVELINKGLRDSARLRLKLPGVTG